MSGTAPYASSARRIAEEIAHEAWNVLDNDPAASKAFWADLQNMEVDDWTQFREAAADEIVAFAAATPSVRRRRRWKTPIHRLRLAAYQCCREAAVLLDEIDLLRPGGGYRDMLYGAAIASWRVCDAVASIQLQDFHGEVLPFRLDD